MLQQIHVLICEIHPYFNSVEWLVVFGGNKAEAINVLAMIKIFS